MSDVDTRVLRRRWERSGAPEDGAAWLTARLRAGSLTRARLQLAAYVGDPSAERAWAAEAGSGGASASDDLPCLVGVAADVDAAWRELSTAALFEAGTARVFDAASREPRLRRLLPVGHAIELRFSYATERPYTRGPAIQVWSGTRAWRRVRGGLGVLDEDHQTVFETEDVEAAVVAAAGLVSESTPVWRGDRHELRLARLRAGALEVPADVPDWLVGLVCWGREALLTGWLVFAERARVVWDAAFPTGPDVSGCLDAARAWLACPCARHRDAAAAALHARRETVQRSFDGGRGLAYRAGVVALQCCELVRAGDLDRVRRIAAHGVPDLGFEREAVRAAVRRVLLPDGP